MTERPLPPTADERLAFDAATRRSPKDFVRICRLAGEEPGQMLNRFDAEPGRWLFHFSLSDLVTDGMRAWRTFLEPIAALRRDRRGTDD
jgi:hypothetical protein